VYFVLGYTCNQRCIHCCNPAEDYATFPEVAPERIISILDKIFSDKEVGSIIVSGGEPTIQSGFFDLIKCLANTPIKIDLLSNSEYFSKKDFLDKFISCLGEKNLRVVTAIHSERPEEHEAVNRAPGSFERTLQGLDSLITAGINVMVKHILTQANWKNLNSFYEFVDTRFSEQVSIQLCSLEYHNVEDDRKKTEMVVFPEISSSLEEMFYTHLLRVKEGSKRQLYIVDMPYCSCDPFYWNLFTQKSGEYGIYAFPTASRNIRVLENSVRVLGEACKNCLVGKICSGVYPSALKIYGDRIVRPITGKLVPY
jgi:MoaA/NifB/PqqE/SkfB family radical SAM enzyme